MQAVTEKVKESQLQHQFDKKDLAPAQLFNYLDVLIDAFDESKLNVTTKK